jgi:hypothetical protein
MSFVMGNCGAVSGEKYYQKIEYKKFLNESDMNKKYQFKNKTIYKSDGSKTIEVYDMIFQKIRILKQVNNLSQ